MRLFSNTFSAMVSPQYTLPIEWCCYLFGEKANGEIPVSAWILWSSEVTAWRFKCHILERKAALEWSLDWKTLSQMQLELEKCVDSFNRCSHWEHDKTRDGWVSDGNLFLLSFSVNRQASKGNFFSLWFRSLRKLFLFPVLTLEWEKESDCSSIECCWIILGSKYEPWQLILRWNITIRVNYNCLMRQIPIFSRSWPLIH